MYTPEFKNILTSTLDGLRAEGLYKEERFIASQQYSQVTLKDGRSVINMCANNYLGLANNPEVMEAAKKAIDQWGFGMASVRFICGTQTLHRQLEERLTQFLGTEDTILFPSCFDANGGLFEGLLTADDAIISDSLNHASIIDGVRLCKAKRFRYANNDMADLEAKLQEAPWGFKLSEVRCPVVLLHGTADSEVPYSAMEETAKELPHARIIKLEGEEHASPAITDRLMEELLQQDKV